MAAAIICCKYTIQGEGVYSLHNNLQHPLYSTKSPNLSIKSPNQSYTNYLVNNLGFTPQQARSTSTKLHTKNADFSKFSNNADTVVDFLKQHCFDDIHVKKVVSSYPEILVSDVDKGLKPRFKLVQDHGFYGSDLVSAFSSNPSFVKMHMDDTLHDLRAILGSNENLIRFFRRTYFFVGQSGLKNLNSNIALLNNEYGVDIQVIQNSILRHPGPYLRNTQFFQNVLVRVEEELGIPRNSGMFLYGVELLCRFSKKTIDSKCQVFKSFGWTEFDVSEILRNPRVFDKSEENIRKKLGLLMSEMGYKPDYLAAHSVFLSYSLEKRMEPRRRVLLVLKEKGLLLNYNFLTVVKKTDKQFVKIYIEPYKEDVPGLLELYQSNKSCSKIDTIPR